MRDFYNLSYVNNFISNGFLFFFSLNNADAHFWQRTQQQKKPNNKEDKNKIKGKMVKK